MTAAIYLGELVFAVGLAVVLLTTSTFASSVATLLFCCGVALLANMARFLRCLPDYRRLRSGRRSRRLRMVFVRPLLRPS